MPSVTRLPSTGCTEQAQSLGVYTATSRPHLTEEDKMLFWQGQKLEPLSEVVFSLPVFIDKDGSAATSIQVDALAVRQSNAEILPCESFGSTSSEQDSRSRTRARLEEMKLQSRRRQLRIRVPAMSLSFVSGFLGFAVGIVGSILGNRLLSVAIPHIVCGWGTICYCMGLLPSDHLLTRRTLKFLWIPVITMLALVNMYSKIPGVIAKLQCACFSCEDERESEAVGPCWVPVVLLNVKVLEVGCVFGTSAWLIVSLCKALSTQQLMRRLWLTLFIVFVCHALATAMYGFLHPGKVYVVSFDIARAINFFIQACVCVHPTCVARVQSWLMTRGEDQVAAAGVATLLGTLSPEDVLTVAKQRFLKVQADQITQADMAQNIPNPALKALARHARIGHVDAFLSHSWHDDAQTKYDTLQKWREEFKIAYGREPSLWIDKYCIDQDNIEESLACLPCFLAGCSLLVVLCGKTYLERLWCLVEVLVFLEMGGDLSRLQVRILADSADGQIMEEALRSFDPSSASCFTQYDTDRLQEVLEIVGRDRISKLVHEVFATKLLVADSKYSIGEWHARMSSCPDLT